MDTQTGVILQQLVAQWDEVNTALSRLNGASTVQPSSGWSVFRASVGPPTNIIEFSFGPIVFNVPERANHVHADLFIVVDGCISFRRDQFEAEDVLVTDGFATRAAYFRRKGSGAEHIYGAHYDFVLDELGHPVFHSQMRSFAELWEEAKVHYGVEGDADDRIVGVLQTVRVPTAQMDVFSFVLQLCADHLLFANSSSEERAAFNDLLGKSAFIQGAGYKATCLASEAARTCYRARHWYPILA